VRYDFVIEGSRMRLIKCWHVVALATVL
jgi:hypothetical protein